MTEDDVKELEKNVKRIAMENRIETCNEEIKAMEVRIDVITYTYDARSRNIKKSCRGIRRKEYTKTRTIIETER